MANLNAKIIDKINKLLAMGNDKAASENERETAIRQAHALLSKYNLELHDLKQSEDRGQLAVLAKKHLWAVRLAGCMADLFFCEYITGSGNANYSYHIFVGTESNTKVATALYLYLVKSLMSEARAYVRRHNISDSPYKAEMDWLKGAVIGIESNARRLRKEKEEENARENGGTGTALVLADYYKLEQEKNQKWVEDNMKVKMRSVGINVGLDNENAQHGFAHGVKINLNTGLPDKTQEHERVS